MGILNKIMFWKKGEDEFGDLDLGADFGLDKDLTGLEGVGTKKPGDMPGFGEKEFSEGFEKPLGASPEAPVTREVNRAPSRYNYESPAPDYGNAPVPQPARGDREQLMIGKELELISTKLDSLKITLDNLNMRVASLERIARGEYEKTW